MALVKRKIGLSAASHRIFLILKLDKNNMENLTHWRKSVSRDALGSWDLFNDKGEKFERTLTIRSFANKDVTGIDGKKNKCHVYFIEEPKPLLLNVTCGNAIAKKLGIYKEKWVGKKITLYVENVKVGQEWVDAIRVKVPAQDAPLPEMNPQHKLWDKLKEAIQSGAKTIDAAKTVYFISPENEALLLAVTPPDNEAV